jgi:predicted pyridoxine 5'-phosphate oxidase superfamily flavin-nucleotide-binding protein
VVDPAATTMGFHAGELAVQRRAGVRAAAERLGGMLDAPELGGGFARFLAERTFAALTARDGAGRLWISPLTRPPGFLQVRGHADLRVHAVPAPGDPLHELLPAQPVGMLAIEFARRRRVRINGTLSDASGDGFAVRVDQAYGNCPQYIQQRLLAPVGPAAGEAPAVRRGQTMSPADVALIRRADTFLLGTSHPDRGADASHRGGSPGFVRVCDDRTLWWPDYPGNNMFNSLGNLDVDPAAALLFVDFISGDTVHLSGTARLDWTASGDGDDGGTGRRLVFTTHAVVAGPPLPLRADRVVASPFNPPLTSRV